MKLFFLERAKDDPAIIAARKKARDILLKAKEKVAAAKAAKEKGLVHRGIDGGIKAAGRFGQGISSRITI